MNRYQVDGGAVSLYAGTVMLTRAQAEPRLGQLEGHALHRAHTKVSAKAEARAPYVIVGEVHFKAGEVLCYDGEVPKAWAHRLVDLHADERAAAQAAAEEAARDAVKAAEALAAQQQDQLLAAMAGIAVPAEGNIDLAELTTQLAGRLDFEPGFEQLESAWVAHVERRA